MKGQKFTFLISCCVRVCARTFIWMLMTPGWISIYVISVTRFRGSRKCCKRWMLNVACRLHSQWSLWFLFFPPENQHHFKIYYMLHSHHHCCCCCRRRRRHKTHYDVQHLELTALRMAELAPVKNNFLLSWPQNIFYYHHFACLTTTVSCILTDMGWLHFRKSPVPPLL